MFASARQLGHYKPRIILSFGLEGFFMHMYETSFPSEHSPRLEMGVHLAFFCWWRFFISVTFLVQPQEIPALCIFNPNSLPSYTQPLSFKYPKWYMFQIILWPPGIQQNLHHCLISLKFIRPLPNSEVLEVSVCDFSTQDAWAFNWEALDLLAPRSPM